MSELSPKGGSEGYGGGDDVLIHKSTMGVLDTYWTGAYRLDPKSGGQVPVEQEYDCEVCPHSCGRWSVCCPPVVVPVAAPSWRGALA